MELNIKSKFNIGDAVTVTRLQESGTVRECRIAVRKDLFSILYLVAFSGGQKRWRGWVPEIDLEALKLVSKFKVGDLVRVDAHHHGSVAGVYPYRDGTVVAVAHDNVPGLCYFRESDLLPYSEISPHYFQD